MVQTTGAMDFAARGLGSDDPRNASVAIRGIESDLGALIVAATAVVQDHIRSCQASVILAEAKVRQRAAERHGGLANAWVYFADPDVLALAKALRKIAGPP